MDLRQEVSLNRCLIVLDDICCTYVTEIVLYLRAPDTLVNFQNALKYIITFYVYPRATNLLKNFI